jgi:hypothetical protein
MMSDPVATDDGYHLIDYTSDPSPHRTEECDRMGRGPAQGAQTGAQLNGHSAHFVIGK